MKKNLVLLSLLVLLASCGKESSTITDKETKAPKTETARETNEPSISDREGTSESEKSEYSLLNITYIFENGTFLSRETKKIGIGEIYQFEPSLSFPFMKPDIQEIKGIKQEKEEDILITYSYDGTMLETPIPSSQYSGFMIDEEKGISFSFLTGQTESGQVLLKGDNFSIQTNGIEAGGRFLSFVDGLSEESFGSSSFVNSKEESALFTYSFFSDKAVFYKNSHRMVTFFNNRTSQGNDPVYSTIYHTMMEELEKSGFTLGTETIHGLSMQCGVTEKQMQKTLSSYLVTEVEFVEKDTGILQGRKSKIGKESYSYAFESLNIPGYEVTDISLLSGIATESKTIQIEDQFTGTEHSLKTNSIDRSNSYGWADQSKWLKYATDLTGDFTMKVSLTNFGASSYTSETAKGGDICWRTLLPIVYDSETGDDWVMRFDWYGWMDDNNKDGKKLGTATDYNGGISYVYSYDNDLYPIYRNMDVDLTYTRRGATLTVDALIKPNNVPYRGQHYDYHCSLSGIQTKKLSFALSAEDSKGTINSLRY